MRRCWNRQKVACVRFKEISATFVDVAIGKMLSKATMKKDYWFLKGLIVTITSHKSPLDDRSAPTNLSTTVWLITRNMLRLGTLCAFRWVMIVRVFNVMIYIRCCLNSTHFVATKMRLSCQLWCKLSYSLSCCSCLLHFVFFLCFLFVFGFFFLR